MRWLDGITDSIDISLSPSLGQEDPLEEGMATYSGIVAQRIPKDRGAWQATIHRVAELDTTDRTWHACPLLATFNYARISAFPLGWPWEAQSSPRVARESWGSLTAPYPLDRCRRCSRSNCM